MALTYLQLKNKLQPYILRFVDKEATEWIFDDEFLDLVNICAHQLNEAAHINVNRYYRETLADTNHYEMNGDIVQVLKFKYEGSDWVTQKYAVATVAGLPFLSVIVLRTTPTAGIQLDIQYLRRCGELTEDTDEVDLPDVALPEYIELVKSKILVDFARQDRLAYERDLEILKSKVMAKLDNPSLYGGKVKRHFGGLSSTADDYYDILHSRLSTDHVIVGDDGSYTWVD
jgi:hypothetical protein